MVLNDETDKEKCHSHHILVPNLSRKGVLVSREGDSFPDLMQPRRDLCAATATKQVGETSDMRVV